MPQQLSFPKKKIKILLLEGIHESAVKTFRADGYTVIDQRAGALSEEELLAIIPDVHILGIRSRTQLTPAVFAAARRLLAVGCFCIGTNQVDLVAAEKAGVPVFNAPFSNTRSVAELTIAHTIHLLRGISEKSAAAHRGEWLKTAKDAYEARGKTLGVVGYGRIGTQASILAESMGMNVLFYDPIQQLPLGNAKQTDNLKQLLAASDVVTLHVPDVAATCKLIGKKELAHMKPGASLINLSRGKVVDIPSVIDALKTGRLAGAAFDVFPEEPASNKDEFVSELRQFDNVILTPHIGGSTQEAQVNIGVEVATKLLGFTNNGTTRMAVNFPEVDLPPQQDKHRLLHIHHNQPGVLSALNDLLAKQSANVAGQYLQTDAEIGYVVVDTDPSKSRLDAEALKAIPGTIKARVLH